LELDGLLFYLWRNQKWNYKKLFTADAWLATERIFYLGLAYYLQSHLTWLVIQIYL
jgi:hypothetical protein